MQSLGNQIDQLNSLLESFLALFTTLGGIFLTLFLVNKKVNLLRPFSMAWATIRKELAAPAPWDPWFRIRILPASLWFDSIGSGSVTVGLAGSAIVVLYGCMTAFAGDGSHLLRRLSVGFLLLVFLAALTRIYFRHFQIATKNLKGFYKGKS